MLRIPGPMSNAERQREYRARHPGLSARRHARIRAAAKRGAAQLKAAAQAAQAMATRQSPELPAPAARE